MTNSISEALKPCPFCGIANLDVSNRYTDHYQVHCMSCGADGASGYTIEAAERNWNTRASVDTGEGDLAYHLEQARTYIAQNAANTDDKALASARFHIARAVDCVEAITPPLDSEAVEAAMTHSEALDAIVGAAGVTTLSYQEAIEGYLRLRGMGQ